MNTIRLEDGHSLQPSIQHKKNTRMDITKGTLFCSGIASLPALILLLIGPGTRNWSCNELNNVANAQIIQLAEESNVTRCFINTLYLQTDRDEICGFRPMGEYSDTVYPTMAGAHTILASLALLTAPSPSTEKISIFASAVLSTINTGTFAYDFIDSGYLDPDAINGNIPSYVENKVYTTNLVCDEQDQVNPKVVARKLQVDYRIIEAVKRVSGVTKFIFGHSCFATICSLAPIGSFFFHHRQANQ